MNNDMINVNSIREYNYELIYPWQSLLAKDPFILLSSLY